jgi:DnaJ-class molecular chaperone
MVVHAAASPTTSLYSALGIPQTASSSEVRKAYCRIALRHHPDKVPESDRPDDEGQFKEIARAYKWLSNKEKQRLYDRYGEHGLEPNLIPGPFDRAYAGASSSGGMGGRVGEGGVLFCAFYLFVLSIPLPPIHFSLAAPLAAQTR